MKAVTSHYGDKLAFGFHRFPLPYHHNAFYAWQAGGVIAGAKPEGVWTWAYAFFGAQYPNQENFTNAATATMSANDVLAQLAAMGEAATGVSKQRMLSGLAYDGPFDDATRASWKYGCSRAVTGTPTFMLNGVLVAGQPSWKLAEWQSVIDPLLA